MEQQPIITVSELNEYIRQRIEGDRNLQAVCIRGELSNYKIHSSGHHYFSVKDSESSLRCVMFRSSAVRLRFRPENGMKVLLYGKVSVYVRDGAYQLYCTNIVPDGLGELQAAYEQLKKQLSEEGLFDPERKKPLPAFPKRIALVTSPTGAAVRDMIRILQKRWPLASVLIVPCLVQGPEAPESIAAALRYADAWHLADLIITGRGGGSLEDLWAFNTEIVARTIAGCSIPVISAVGHEPDVTISDFTADLRASTPSNAAELAVPDRQEIRNRLNACFLHMNTRIGRTLSEKAQFIRAARRSVAFADPETILSSRRQDLDRYYDKLTALVQDLLRQHRSDLQAKTGMLQALDVNKVLSRGYTIVTKGEQVIDSARELAEDESILIRFRDGQADCLVRSIRVQE
jgi:exodeoxyribonuclease VII large subunit